ncbi:MAG TPA: zf-HC2 domain-containing protein [Phycisphaerae bacterium]|nr:zf-HC2 domain-containing protein [Phycisphaerae bacterium]
MNCSDVRQFLFAYADGELTDGGQPEVGAHFASCGPCGALVKEHRALRAALRRSIERIAIPKEVEDRIRNAIKAEQSAKRGRGLRILFGFKPLAIAAVIAIGVGVSWYATSGGTPAHPVAVAVANKHKYCSDRASVHHHEGLPTTLAGLPGAINAHENYRFAAIAPDLSAFGFYFESANFCGLKDRNCRNGGHVVYARKDGNKVRRFSIFSVPKAGPLDDLEALVKNDDDLHPVKASPEEGGPELCIVLWHKDTTHYVCCGDVPPDELTKMANTVYTALADPGTEAMFVRLARGR